MCTAYQTSAVLYGIISVCGFWLNYCIRNSQTHTMNTLYLLNARTATCFGLFLGSHQACITILTQRGPQTSSTILYQGENTSRKANFFTFSWTNSSPSFVITCSKETTTRDCPTPYIHHPWRKIYVCLKLNFYNRTGFVISPTIPVM
jgi:hypothetical protein